MDEQFSSGLGTAIKVRNGLWRIAFLKSSNSREYPRCCHHPRD